MARDLICLRQKSVLTGLAAEYSHQGGTQSSCSQPAGESRQGLKVHNGHLRWAQGPATVCGTAKPWTQVPYYFF